MASETRGSIESVALVGPPPINANIVERLVNWPVTTDLPIVRPATIRRASARQRRSGTRIIHPASQPSPFEYSVKHHFEVLAVQLVDHLLRIREVRWVPGELAVVCVPARRTEVRAEIDKRIAWQLFLTERGRHPLDLVRPAKRAMRLQIAKRPQGRHLRMASQPRIFFHYL